MIGKAVAATNMSTLGVFKRQCRFIQTLLKRQYVPMASLSTLTHTCRARRFGSFVCNDIVFISDVKPIINNLECNNNWAYEKSHLTKLNDCSYIKQINHQYPRMNIRPFTTSQASNISSSKSLQSQKTNVENKERTADTISRTPIIEDIRASPAPKKMSVIKKTDEQLMAEIREVIKTRKVVIFMKGNPEAPECGFSKRAVEILVEVGCANFTFVDVLRSQRIRELVKQLSGWPTVPQLYVDGEFVGGCDIMIEMFKSGELKLLLEKSGVTETTSTNTDINVEKNSSPTTSQGSLNKETTI